MPRLAPVTLGTVASFGFGDRLGAATPGHLRALPRQGGAIAGIFPQQSIREMTRTGRSPEDVMRDAVDALEAAGYGRAFGADADHLKTPTDVDRTAAAGFTFFTIDPSDHVDQRADDYDQAAIEAKYRPQPWVDAYLGRSVELDDGTPIAFDESTVKRAAVKYGPAIAHAVELSEYIARAGAERGMRPEIEISVDETE